MTKAEERALEKYPTKIAKCIIFLEAKGADFNTAKRMAYQEGYEQAEKDFLAIVKEYLEKGLRCMEQEGESQIYTFWDGFHNCAENILRELEDEK